MHKSGSDGKFTSSIGFVLAAVGSAVGMANIWLFPYRVGQYGGGAFLIPYFLFVALFSYVGLSGEFALGRLTGTGAMGSLDYVLRQRGRRGGRVLGAIPLLGVLGIAIGYSVVVGWVLRYAAGSLTGSVLAGDAQGFFSALAVDFGSIPWHFAAVAVTAAILIFGVASGIEKLSKVMMPAFFILFLIIAVRVAFLPGAMEGYLYLLRPDWSYLLNPETWVMAMGQAFFSLSINGAGMLIYGSYMKKGENILRHAGMTAVLDTLAALREAKRLGARVLSIVNVVGSTIARESDDVLYTWAGPEIAVATTKAFSTQLAVVYLIGLYCAEALGTLDEAEYDRIVSELLLIPTKLEQILDNRADIQYFASLYFNHPSIFFIGRNIDYAIGMEGSLKLKEISYIHSEAYAAGELKHGTISLIEPGTLVVALASYVKLFDKTMSNVVEVKSRGADVLGLTVDARAADMAKTVDHVIPVPDTHPLLLPSLDVVPMQLFAYYVALQRGCDIDKPRNLAKSVTVE